MAMLVSHTQKGNPVLSHIRHVWWEYASIVPDYVIGRNSCALYLSLRFHRLNANYLYKRCDWGGRIGWLSC